MIPDISNQHILKVHRCMVAFRDKPTYKMRPAVPLLDQLGEEERWLLSFIKYLVVDCRLWRTLNDSHYYPVPTATEQQAEFSDFIALLRHYRRKRVTHKNEKTLIVFLRRCDTEHRDFYLSLMTRQRWLTLFMRHTRDYIDHREFHPDDIFGGEVSQLQTSFQALTFPILVTTVPAKHLPSGIIYRSAQCINVSRFEGKRRVRLSGWLKLDAKLIQSPSFVLTGLVDEEAGRFYPLDYYESMEQFRRHTRRGGMVPPYYLRLRRLDDFLKHNYLRQIQKVPKEYVISDSEIEGAVRRVLVGSPHTTLMFRDAKRATYCMDSIEVKGVIGDIWQEGGVAKGFVVWHNTYPICCSYDFSGASNALLFRPEILAGRVALIWLFIFENFRSGSVREILFDEKPFSDAEIDLQNGTFGRVEKCAYCAKDGTQVNHKYKGICYNTNCNWQSAFGRSGADTWITPTPRLKARREATAWEPFMLNNIAFTYKGYRIVCREEDGAMMFKSDEELMRKYLYRVNEDSKWANGLREIGKLKYITAEDIQRRYFERGEERKSETHTAAVGDAAEEDQGR